MERILGIDYGDRRIGIAVSDLLGLTAQGIETVSNESFRKAMERICAIIDQNFIRQVVIGLPRNMDGSLGFRADATQSFANELKKERNVDIIFEDERLTTVSAHRFLNETDTRGKKRKQVIDTLSAQIILQTYLDRIKK